VDKFKLNDVTGVLVFNVYKLYLQLAPRKFFDILALYKSDYYYYYYYYYNHDS